MTSHRRRALVGVVALALLTGGCPQDSDRFRDVEEPAEDDRTREVGPGEPEPPTDDDRVDEAEPAT